jgi:hypothetical protein
VDWLAPVLTAVGLVGTMFGFLIKWLDKKFEAIDRRFEAVDRRFEVVDRRFESVNQRLDTIGMRINQLESRVSVMEGILMAMGWRSRFPLGTGTEPSSE